MLGNDVVDLRDAEARAEHAPRFDARVFCPDERDSLDRSPSRAARRWRLWAAKEAAYKAVVKSHPETVFSPVRFRVHLPQIARSESDAALVEPGWVETPHGRLTVQVRVLDGAVHAVVGERPELASSGMTRVVLAAADTAAPSREVRRFAAAWLAAKLGIPLESIEIRRLGRVPVLWIDGRRAAALSLSHHGGVVAFACEVTA